MKVTILGCGSSSGVPMLKYGWGDCDPNNPKNRRSRSSVLIEKDGTSLLTDMSPDLRQQLLDYGVARADGVIFTHAHYDHINGLNELRPIFFGQKERLHVYAGKKDLDIIRKAFFYLFEESDHKIYKPYIKTHVIEKEFSVGKISGICFEQDHGFSTSLGIRIDNFAYSTDVVSLSEEAFEALRGIDTWVVDCLSMKSGNPSHAHLDQVLEWVKRINPRRTFLTHMGITMDYDTLLRILPENVKPAYDQMTFFV
ncbi:MAG: MBL fold metallo-hydrolase [Holosporaceae bacterium]|jgi:phosphoribosyl 1,2-cyclic phosphate phosphodiesterase|nr:MBL fold metallo-hydrolase [Holosporaceae bacterium]